MSAKDTKTTAAKTAAAKRRERAAAKKAEAAAALAAPIPTPALDAVAPADTPVREPIAARNTLTEAWNRGDSIAKIAADAGLAESEVEERLDAARAEKPAKATGPKVAAGPKTLLASFNGVLAKKADKGSRRSRVEIALATGQNHGDLVEIVAALSALADGEANASKLAAASYALLSALNSVYATA